jgi:hypothetical protein
MYISLYGGIGNILFQIAFSKKIENLTQQSSKCFFSNITFSEEHELHAYNFIQKYKSYIKFVDTRELRFKRKLFSNLNKYCRFKSILYLNETNITKIPFYTNPYTILDGYWQSKLIWPEGISEVYNFIPNIILSDIFSKNNHPLINRIAIHFRGGDYFKSQNKNFLSYDIHSYITKSINLLPKNIPIIVVTNDLRNAKKFFYNEFYEKRIIYYSNTNPIEDLQILSQSSYVITANSTFSYLAAEHSRRQGGVCISPISTSKLNSVNNNFLYLNWMRL